MPQREVRPAQLRERLFHLAGRGAFDIEVLGYQAVSVTRHGQPCTLQVHNPSECQARAKNQRAREVLKLQTQLRTAL